jgi:hypothetical protein
LGTVESEDPSLEGSPPLIWLTISKSRPGLLAATSNRVMYLQGSAGCGIGGCGGGSFFGMLSLGRSKSNQVDRARGVCRFDRQALSNSSLGRIDEGTVAEVSVLTEGYLAIVLDLTVE